MFELKQRLVVTPKAQLLPGDSAVATAVATAPTSSTAMVSPKAHPGAADPSIDHRVGPSAVWQPASSARIQLVESTVIVGTLAYFAYGLAAAFGLF